MKTPSELREIILEKAILDNSFRTRLKADPVGTLKNELNVGLPDGFNIQIHEDDGVSTSHIVLPPPTEMTEEEFAEVGAAGCDSGDYFYDCDL